MKKVSYLNSRWFEVSIIKSRLCCTKWIQIEANFQLMICSIVCDTSIFSFLKRSLTICTSLVFFLLLLLFLATLCCYIFRILILSVFCFVKRYLSNKIINEEKNQTIFDFWSVLAYQLHRKELVFILFERYQF